MMASITGDCSLYHKEQNDKLRQEVVEEEEQLEEEDEEMSDLKVFPVNPSSSTISAVLETRDLWKQFDELGTEMIVTRRGRRMFPPIKVELHDLNPTSSYVLLMDLVPVDKYRYKYQNSSWVKCFEEACAPTRLYVHPESPALGSYWMDHVISFYKLKLTNNQLDKQGHIIVNSMHSYQPRLHIVESNDIQNLMWENFNTIIFPGTKFTTVTAYQNDKITQLKIENNPFAKGFRHPLSRHRMRPNQYRSKLSESGSIEESAHSTKDPYKIRILKRPSSGSDDEVPTKQVHISSGSSTDEGIIQVHENPALKNNSPSVPMYIMCNPFGSTAQIIQNGSTIPTEVSMLNAPNNCSKIHVVHVSGQSMLPPGLSIPPLRQEISHSPFTTPIHKTAVLVDTKKRSSLTSSDSSSDSDCESDVSMSHSPNMRNSPPPLRKDVLLPPRMEIPTTQILHNKSVSYSNSTPVISSASPQMALKTLEATPNQGIIVQATPQFVGCQKILVPLSIHQNQQKVSPGIMMQPNSTAGNYIQVVSDEQQQQQPIKLMPIYQMAPGGQPAAGQQMQFLTLPTQGGSYIIQGTTAA